MRASEGTTDASHSTSVKWASAISPTVIPTSSSAASSSASQSAGRLVYEPRVLLLDEPLSNLDAKLREEARYLIRKLILDLEICAILVTHDQTEVLAAADHILLLKDGRIVQEDSPLEIYSNPNSFYSADFLGANNIARGKLTTLTDDRAIIGGDGWTLEGMDQGSQRSDASRRCARRHPGRADPRRRRRRPEPAGNAAR
jgi:iron(III) transport system ATP-binding protein